MRTVEEIYEELLAAFAEQAGYVPDDPCDLAVRLYAVAAQVQALEMQADWVLDQSFPQTAQGDYLDCHAAMRGLTRQAAAQAAGTLRFSAAEAPVSDLVISQGSVCMTAEGTRFETTSDAVLTVGSLWVDVPAQAVEAGSGGNAAPNTVTVLAVCPVGITVCTNPAAFTGGEEEESDEDLRSRVLESYQRLPNGANAAFYEEQAMRHEGVEAAIAVGRARGIGTVDVYLATAAGAPDAELLEEVEEDLQARREIAVDLQVLAPTLNSVDITVEIAVADGMDFAQVKSGVEMAVTGLFGGKLLGKSLLLAQLGKVIYAVDGVENYRILTPEGDVAGDTTALPVLGTLTVTEMEA